MNVETEGHIRYTSVHSWFSTITLCKLLILRDPHGICSVVIIMTMQAVLYHRNIHRYSQASAFTDIPTG